MPRLGDIIFARKFMRCPSWHNEETKVIDSRSNEEGSIIRRRRECEKCGFRFSTYEQLEILNLEVVKKNSEREEYDREKLASGIRKACMKRPITLGQIRNLVADIEDDIMKNLSDSSSEDDVQEIQSTEIGNIVMEKLIKLDKVAYIRFASVYKSYKDLTAFDKEINQIKE